MIKIIPSGALACVLLALLTLSPVFALPPEGPLAQISSSSPTVRSGGFAAAEFRAEIEGAETIEVSFIKTTRIKGSEKSFPADGKIYYVKEPLLFRAELPSETLQIDGKTRKRFVKKYNEIYIDEWSGGNPLFMYFDIPGGVYESDSSRTPRRTFSPGRLPAGRQGYNTSASSYVVFSAQRDGDKIEAVYDKAEKMLKSVKVENAVMETFTEIKSWEKNKEISPEVFDFPRGAKRIDMRK